MKQKRKTTIRRLADQKTNFTILADMELDLVPSFRIAKIIEAFNDIMDTFDKQKEKVLKRYFKVQPRDGVKGVYNEGFTEEQLRDEIDALLNEEIEIEFEPVKKSKLTSKGNLIAIKPGILNGITWAFIEDLPEDSL